MKRKVLLTFFVLSLIHTVCAFDITFTSASCSQLLYTLTLEPFEVQQGSRVVINAIDGGNDQQITYLDIGGHYTSSVLTNSFIATTKYYTRSGSYPVRTEVLDANGNTIQYNNDGTADSEVDNVNVVCAISTTPVTYPSTTTTTTTTTTPTVPPTTTTPTVSPTTTGIVTTTYTYYCSGTPTVTTAVHAVLPTFSPNTYCPAPIHRSNKSAVIGGAVGGAIGILAITFGVILYVLCKRKKRSTDNTFAVPTLTSIGTDMPARDVDDDLEKENEYVIESRTPYS